MAIATVVPEGILPEYADIYGVVKELPLSRGKYDGRVVFGIAWVHGGEPQIMVHNVNDSGSTNIRFSEIDPTLIANA